MAGRRQTTSGCCTARWLTGAGVLGVSFSGLTVCQPLSLVQFTGQSLREDQEGPFYSRNLCAAMCLRGARDGEQGGQVIPKAQGGGLQGGQKVSNGQGWSAYGEAGPEWGLGMLGTGRAGEGDPGREPAKAPGSRRTKHSGPNFGDFQ